MAGSLSGNSSSTRSSNTSSNRENNRDSSGRAIVVIVIIAGFMHKDSAKPF